MTTGVAYFSCDWQFEEWDGYVKIFVGSSEGADYTVNDNVQITIRTIVK